MKNAIALCCAVIAAILTGCVHKTTMINVEDDRAGAIAGFDYRDIENSLDTAVDDLLARGRLDSADGGRAVLNIMEIRNDTSSLGRDADALSNILEQGLKERLTNQQKVLVYNPAAAQYATVKITPQFALFGQITERNLRMDNGDIQKEYRLLLTLVETATGIEWWQKTVFIGKRMDVRNAVW